ncbi:MAG: glycosyltransferase family 2 protein [Pseudonocardiaceae bacterium]
MTSADSHGMALSVVVATRGRSEGCRRMCTALEAQLAEHPSLRAEVVLVFDGSAPYDWLRTSELYRCLHLRSRVGIARARNAGIESASGEVLAFLDDDAVPAAGWLSSLLVGLDVYPQMVAFGGRVIGSDQHNLYAQLRDQVYYRETFGGWYVDRGAEGDLIGAPYVNGANSAYRREVVLDAGGFDGVLPAYSDVELGRRLGLDRRAALLAGMTIQHDHPSSFGQYMLRCYRSGRARGLLWSRYRYRQDAPGRVAASILVNVVWNNVVRRAGRVKASRLRAAAVLCCQELLHGVGYARSLVAAG